MYAIIGDKSEEKERDLRVPFFLSLILTPVEPNVESTARLYLDLSASKLLSRVCTTRIGKPIQLRFFARTKRQTKACTKPGDGRAHQCILLSIESCTFFLKLGEDTLGLFII